MREFKSGDLFVVQTFINDLNWNFGLLFWTAFLMVEAKVSFDRLSEVLQAEEIVGNLPIW